MEYSLTPMQRRDEGLAAELRAALAASERAVARVSLDSGPCWVTAVAVRPGRRGAELRVEVELAGARLVLPASRVLAVARG